MALVVSPANPRGAIEVHGATTLAQVDAVEWDRLVGPHDPFMEHAFLLALEQGGCLGDRTGWHPCHLLARDASGALRGAVPLCELCYYRPIELCIQRGLQRFEAGAQGVHKLKRGLLPCPTYSAHWLRHPALSDAVEHHLALERRAVEQEMAALAGHGPFRRDAGSPMSPAG